MIIVSQKQNGDVNVLQRVREPLLYFDNWFWCDLTHSKDLLKSFQTFIRKVRPSIMFSFISLFELGKWVNEAKNEILLELIDEFDFGLFDCNPVGVMKRENYAKANGLPFSACLLDKELLKGFVVHLPRADEKIRLSDFLGWLNEKDNQTEVKAINSNFLENVLPIIERARNAPQIYKEARTRLRDQAVLSSAQPHTWEIYRRINDYLVVNKTMKLDESDWADIMHLIVPLAYFNFICCDKRWYEFANEHIPLKHPEIARTYYRTNVMNLFSDVMHYIDSKNAI